MRPMLTTPVRTATNRRFAIETRRTAADSTKVRPGEATIYQGWY